MKETINTFLKGILIGICETIPGISGSTMALFLGIYQKLISTIHNFLPRNLFKILKLNANNKNKVISELNLKFFLTLIFGMISAVILFSHIIGFLFNNYKLYLLSFFVSFIVTSTIYQGKKYLIRKNQIQIICGILLGLSLLFISPREILDNSFISIIIAGMVTITFGLLPGISGSFMLLIIGKYEFILENVQDLNFEILIYFLTGIIFGAVLFIDLINKLFKKHKEKSLAFFFSFVLASISILLKDIIEIFYLSEILIIIFYLIIGILTGIHLQKFIKN